MVVCQIGDSMIVFSIVGWAVQIKRKDGTTFLASSGTGDTPAIWCKQNRKWAVKHKKELRKHNLKCRVVQVQYFEPWVVEDKE